ncbi:MAG TPA: diguanylate cyclase [Anaerolineales bacterium]|nr:diguanylate cyclase [Anaerolineales bacterium]
MDVLHSLLKRQLSKFSDEAQRLIEEQPEVIQAINDAYLQFEADRRMLEHSLELTSQELKERNAELSRINRELEMRVKTRTADLSNNEARFRGLFEYAPVSIWEEDFSGVRQFIDDLSKTGVQDFSAHFDQHPEDLAECVRRVKIVNVNRATLEMYQAESKEELLADLSQVLGDESLTSFKEELLSLIRGDLIFESELINNTLLGEKRVVFLRLTVAPGFEQSWAKVFVGISDITERRKAETALAAERDLLQALLDNIPDTIYFKDTESRFTRINRAQSKVLGVATPEDAMGKTDFDFFPDPALANGFYEEEQQIVKTGESLTNRVEFHPTRDGQPRWFAATKVPIKDDNGNIIGIVGVSRDITALKKAEDALREAEIKYRALVEHLPAIVYLDEYDPTVSAGYRPLYMSPQVEVILGYRPEEFLEDPELWPSLLHPDDRERALSTDARHYQAGEMLRQEYHVVARDGHVVWLSDEAAMIRDEVNGKIFSQGVLLDITARKQAEEALRLSEERFRLISWATKDAVWDWNLSTNQIQWGAGLQKIFHYSAETFQTDAEWWRNHIHPQDRAKVDRTLKQALDGGLEFWSKEYRFQRKDGEYVEIMDRAYILRNEAGNPYRMIGAMMDITERKQTELALQDANEKMARSLNELEMRNQEIRILNEMSDLLQGSSFESQAHAIIGDAAKRLFPDTFGALYLFNSERTVVNRVTFWGDPPPLSQSFTPNDCWALRRGQTHQLYEDEESKPLCGHILEFPPAVTFCLPMVAQGEILGVLHLHAKSKDHITESKHQLIYTVAEQAAMALSNLKLREALREQSIRDPLTGLFNRRYMEEVLTQHLRRVTRNLHPLGIIMIDIDHFKLFNDSNGHAAGDALLRELGDFLKRRIRGEDVACRYGGEEFLLIMPEASLEAAYQRAELLRQGSKGLRVRDADKSLGGITLSLGVAIYPQHGRTMDIILRAADAALYRAKQEGRDRVVVADEGN